MKKMLTISEARSLFESEKVFATNNGGFIFNDQGKYCSGLTYVLDSSFELDKDGKVINPIQFVGDREVTDSFNLDLDGEAKILFGDFWKSQKGASCFRPKDPTQAKHILVQVDWGGCFNGSRGYYGNAVEECGATYFRRARSNGGGAGYDYWVLPVGYVHQLDTNVYRIDWEAARAYCAKHSQLQADQRAEADRLYKEKVAAEETSIEAKPQYLPRLEKLKAELEALPIYCVRLSLPDDGPYFIFGGSGYYYCEERVAMVEEYLAGRREAAEKAESEKLAKQQKWAEVLPTIEALRTRAEALNLSLTDDGREKISLRRDEREIAACSYPFDALHLITDAMNKVAEEMEKKRAEAAKAEREAEAKATGLPSNIRIWKRTGGRTGCSKGWVIGVDGVERERDRIYNENSNRARRYDEGFEIWNQILPGELVIQWTKSCTAAEHVCEVIHRPETISEAQLERVAEIQQEIEEEWEELTGLVSGNESPSIGDGWLGQLAV